MNKNKLVLEGLKQLLVIYKSIEDPYLTGSGLCYVCTTLDDRLKSPTLKYIANNQPRYFKLYNYQPDMVSLYWKPGKKTPRIKYLKKHIYKLEKKIF